MPFPLELLIQWRQTNTSLWTTYMKKLLRNKHLLRKTAIWSALVYIDLAFLLAPSTTLSSCYFPIFCPPTLGSTHLSLPRVSHVAPLRLGLFPGHQDETQLCNPKQAQAHVFVSVSGLIPMSSPIYNTGIFHSLTSCPAHGTS